VEEKLEFIKLIPIITAALVPTGDVVDNDAMAQKQFSRKYVILRRLAQSSARIS
jgi:hypothetical protein